MPITCTRASRWPRLFANSAAAIFIAASGTTNIVYGFGKGDTLATSLVWASVAGAVAIVLALSWPALIRSLDQKRWSAAAISLVALLLSGTYSVTAALGSAASGRANAAATETANVDARAKAQAAYDAAKIELNALRSAKPSNELQSLMDGAKAELAKLPSTRTIAELEALMRRGCPNPRSGMSLRSFILSLVSTSDGYMVSGRMCGQSRPAKKRRSPAKSHRVKQMSK
jgi:hypothetical protein